MAPILSSQSGNFRCAGDTLFLWEYLKVLDFSAWLGEEMNGWQSLKYLRWKIHNVWEGEAHSWKRVKSAVTHGVGEEVSFRSLERWRCMSGSLGLLASLRFLLVDNQRLQPLLIHALDLCSLSCVWPIPLSDTEGEARCMSCLHIVKLIDSFFFFSRAVLVSSKNWMNSRIRICTFHLILFSPVLASCMMREAHLPWSDIEGHINLIVDTRAHFVWGHILWVLQHQKKLPHPNFPLGSVYSFLSLSLSLSHLMPLQPLVTLPAPLFCFF